MEKFTGWEYLLIDAANHYGYSEEYGQDLDKLLYRDRIQWTIDRLDYLEDLIETSDKKTRPQFVKAVLAIRSAQRGEATGHLVGFDASCSGIQIMSVLTGCEVGAYNTGLIDPNLRADAYTTTTETMNDILGGSLEVSRSDAKKALMTSFYGSKKTPKEIFGEDTPEINAFYQAAQKVAPGAWELLQVLLNSWNAYALEHRWILPDGFDARIKVMEKMETRIEVDELDHATFTYTYYDNVGTKTGLSNAANVVHSVDAYVLRCVQRRCNYDPEVVEEVYALIKAVLAIRKAGQCHPVKNHNKDSEVHYYQQLYEHHQIADVVILPYINEETIHFLSTPHLEKLYGILQEMMEYSPFPVVTIHDEYKCHPNNMNHLRKTYASVLADVADSSILSCILSQLYGQPVTYNKLSTGLASKVRNANYAIC